MKYKKVVKDGRTIHIGVCQKCGNVLEHCGSAAQRYCPDCKIVVDREKSRERMRRYRARMKEL